MGIFLLAALCAQDDWTPKVRRTGTQDLPTLELSGTEKLVDGSLLTVSGHLVLKFRRTPGDIPEPLDKRLEKFAHQPPTRTERTQVQEGAWKHELGFNSGTLVPGVYEVTLAFDPTAQRPEVSKKLSPDTASINRKTVLVLAVGRDESYWAEEVERMHVALKKAGAEFQKAEDLAKKNLLTRSAIERMCNVIHEQVVLMEPIAECTMLIRTTWQFFDITGQILRANEHTSDAEGPEGDPPAQVGPLAIDAFEGARSMFSGEVYLYMRTMLAELRDGTWAAYTSALTREKMGPWKEWKPQFTSIRNGLGRAHKQMKGYEEAEFYNERAWDQENPKTSISWALETLDKLAEACERRLNDPKAQSPEALLKELNENLPPAPP